jgi:hypothetical protein
MVVVELDPARVVVVDVEVPGDGAMVVVEVEGSTHAAMPVRLQARISCRRHWRFAFLGRIGARAATQASIAATQAGLQTACRSA